MLVTLNELYHRRVKAIMRYQAFDCMEDVMIRTLLDTAEQERSPIF